jgi:hypothetical protein
MKKETITLNPQEQKRVLVLNRIQAGQLSAATCPKKLQTHHPEISSTNLRFTPESGEEVRQCGEQVRQHLVFGLKVEYALSSEVCTRFLGRF